MSTQRRNVRFAPLALALIVGAGCSDAAPLGPEPTRAPEIAGASSPNAFPARPLRQRSWGTMAPVGPCSGGVRFEARGEGLGSHVGRFDIEIGWCMDPFSGVILDGSARVEARGGHGIAMEITGRAPSADRLLMRARIAGGSGRFADAAGLLDVEVHLEPTGLWTSAGEGWIAY